MIMVLYESMGSMALNLFLYMPLNQKGQCCFSRAEKEITVLQYMTAAYHADLNENPDHQAHTENSSCITREGMSSETHQTRRELARAVDQEQDDTGNPRIF